MYIYPYPGIVSSPGTEKETLSNNTDEEEKVLGGEATPNAQK